MRGRKAKYHRPHRITAIIEEADFEAWKATGLTLGSLIRQGLKECSLSQPEVILKLAREEERMAREHREDAELHEHRAHGLYSRVKQAQVVEAPEITGEAKL